MARKNYAYPFLLFLIIIIFIVIFWKMGDLSNKLDDVSSILEDISGRSLIKTFEKVKKATVFIITEIDSPEDAEGMTYYIIGNQTYAKTGSGFIVDPDGYVVTARHVISGWKEGGIKVRLVDETGFCGVDFLVAGVAEESNLDLAVLKIIPDSKLNYLEIASEEDILIGEKVGFSGFPYGDPNKKPRMLLSEGIISGEDFFSFGGESVPVIFLNAFVNPGNSGGPVFIGSSGKVIGIINQRINDEIGSQTGIGVSSKVTYLLPHLEEIKKGFPSK